MKSPKDPIKLRKRELRNGNTSLYLDIYMNGKRRYEFLNLYLTPEKARADKDKNKETLRLAEAVRAKRIIEFQNGRFGFKEGQKSDTNFLDYFRDLCEKQRRNPDSHANWNVWRSTLKHLENYCSSDITFRDITPEYIRGFKDYLNTKAKILNSNDTSKSISDSSKRTYFHKFRACINSALTDGIIERNPLRGIEDFKREDGERVYLTFEEVQALAATDCKYPGLRRAFLFSCLTGLRKSDIQKMTWSEVRQQGEFTRIVFKQKKTGGQEYIDINPQAADLLGDRGDPSARVFSDFRYTAYHLTELRLWAARAGITKDVTFHSGRHTFAVLMLDLGADLYTVQKLLGHKDIKTTQIYAHLMDKKKQEAAMLIPPILPNKIPENQN